LLSLWPLRHENGSSLPLGYQLRRGKNSKIFRSFLFLYYVHERICFIYGRLVIISHTCMFYFKCSILVRKTIHCVDVRWKECTWVSPPLAVVLTLILCFEALLFLLFTAIMFCTQIHAISVDETGIEQLKGL